MTRMKVRASFFVVADNIELEYVFRYLWDFQNDSDSDEGWVDHQRNTTCCQENENQVCNSPFVARFSACLWANCQHDVFAGEEWRKSLFNLHHCGRTTLINRQIFFQDRPVPELVAATGSGISGGFTLFQVLFHSLSLFSVVLIHGTCTSAIFRSLPKGNSISSVALVGYGHCLYVNL